MSLQSFTRYWSALVLLVFVVSANCSVFAQSQAQPGSGTLAAIRVSGNKRFASDQIAAATGLRTGQSVRREDFQAAADRLGHLGLFSNVRYRFTSKGEYVELEFNIEETPGVPAWFDNFPWFTDSELENGIKDSIGLYDGTAPQDGAYLDMLSDVLVKLLATHGIHGTVEHTLIREPDGDSMIQEFHLAGPNLKIASVEFGDALASRDRGLQERLRDVVGKPYSRYSVSVFEAEQVRPVYLAQGYLQVRFEKPSARFAGNPNAPLPDTVVVMVPIHPGAVYHWNAVAWSGNSTLPTAELSRWVTFRAGDLANGMAIEAAWDRVRAAYGARGYLDAQVEPTPRYDAAKASVSYQVNLTEGSQYRMGELVLTGLSLDGERRLRAAWRLRRGDVFDKGYYEEFLNHGAKEAFGDLPVHYDKIGRLLRPNEQTKTVDVLLDFE